MRDKLGVTEARLSMDRQLRYLQSYVQLVSPERIEFTSDVRGYVLNKAATEFGIHDFELSVHKNDLMFHHQLVRFPDSSAEAVYVYYKVGMAVCQKMMEHLPSSFKVNRLLDFGSGYGRVSRFYPHFFPNAEILVSEIKENALRYQQEALGFTPVLHGSEPQELGTGKFDLIIAISVFTHLPEELTRSWLKQLYTQLEDGGKMLFTYVNVNQLPSEFHTRDYHFTTHSEDAGVNWVSDRITNQEAYGSAFYTEEKLRKLVQEELGVEPEIVKALSGKQDGAIISK